MVAMVVTACKKGCKKWHIEAPKGLLTVLLFVSGADSDGGQRGHAPPPPAQEKCPIFWTKCPLRGHNLIKGELKPPSNVKGAS